MLERTRGEFAPKNWRECLRAKLLWQAGLKKFYGIQCNPEERLTWLRERVATIRSTNAWELIPCTDCGNGCYRMEQKSYEQLVYDTLI